MSTFHWAAAAGSALVASVYICAVSCIQWAYRGEGVGRALWAPI